MRTREIIDGMASEVEQAAIGGNVGDGSIIVQNSLILEVLLDIRDLLSKEPT